MNAMLNVDAKLKEAVIKLFLDMHPSQIDLVPEEIPYKFWVRLLNPDQKENLQDQIDK